jgi:hypothetical protein
VIKGNAIEEKGDGIMAGEKVIHTPPSPPSLENLSMHLVVVFEYI